MGRDGLERHLESGGLDDVGVGHHAADEGVRRARDVGDALGDHPPRARLGNAESATLLPQRVEHHGRQVRPVFAVAVLAGALFQQGRGGGEPALGVAQLQAPGREPQIHPIRGRQIGERERGDLRFDLPDALGERRFGDARGAHAARQDDVRRSGPPPGVAARQPGEHLFHQQPAHLARHAGQKHGNAAARVLDPQPGGGAARVGEDARPFRHLRLRAIDGRHRTPHAPEPRLDVGQELGVGDQPLAEQLRHDSLGHVVAGGAETPRREDEPGALERLGHGAANRLRAIGDRGAARDLGARRRQRPPQLGGVGVDGMTEQQLRADRDDFELHPPPLSSAR